MKKPLAITIVQMLIGVFGAAAQISSPTLYVPQVFDVRHYDAELRFANPATRQVVGRVETRVGWNTRVSDPEYKFHLRGLSIDSVFVGKTRVSWTTLGAVAEDTMHHRIVVPGAHDSGSVSTIAIHYSGTMTNEGGSSPWGGVQYDDSVLYALGVGFANASVGATQHWLPCYDHPSDKVTFTGRFTVPDSTWLVASNGIEGPRTPNADGSVTYLWSEARPVATYLLTFAAARFRVLSMPGRVPHVFYVLRRDSTLSARSYRLVPKMTEVYSELYGNYPFDKVGYYNSVKGSMEHQGMIALALSVARSGDTANVTGAHELAHQWFGDCVSPLDFRYAWLTESFATYSECSWLEALRGRTIYLSAVQGKARSYITQIAKSEGIFALEDFPRKAPSSNYPGTIYAKGAVVLAMARAICGDSAFYASLRRYIADHAYGTAVTEDFRRAIEPALGGRTDAFFREWVTGIGWPRLTVDQVSTSDAVEVTITQVQRQTNPAWPIFSTLPLNVLYTRPRDGAPGIDTVDAIVYPDGDGVVRFSCRQLLGVNTGGLVRSLVEITRTTSVSSDNALPSVTYTLAPQPASDDVVIQRSDASTAAKVQIVDLRGTLQTELTFGQGASQLPVDLTELPSGAYRVLVSWKGSQIALPLMVTRGE
ncbi:MAG: hypothetical protein FGM33_06445 [Candidatus Kapabacteria bacterium]|nr:hypothetical protein [Candidatus Kapabacteria bacterium]